jgi:pyruvate dehydrogenase E2 component (dihydrolipoamide acetyltransferase)
MGTLRIRMPALSATMEDAELLTWLVDVGDQVRTGQPLAEVTTDKVDMELESPYDGTIEALLAGPGSRVKLGETVATLLSDEEDLLGDLDLGGPGDDDAEASVRGEGAGDQAAAPGDAGSGGAGSEELAPEAAAGAWQEPPRQRIAPAPPPVRRRARQLGIDLHEVAPTGARGQVTHADLSAYQAAREAVSTPGAEASRSPAPRPATAAAAEVVPSSPAPASPQRAVGDRSRRRAIRLATARTTIRSAAVPQFTLYRRLDVSMAQERRAGRSWTTELARALAAALWRHPECNAVWDAEAEEPVALETVRIGIAVDTPDGLVVVAVDDPDGVDPVEADARIRSAIERGRAGRVSADDQREVSSTISNLGGLGIDRFDALLVPPQPTILSVGRIVETPVVVDGRVRVRPLLEVGLTVDHRVADGADGARLLDTFATRLEG